MLTRQFADFVIETDARDIPPRFSKDRATR